MPKTYTALTVANATAGNAILASDIATVFTNSNNYRVPPSVRLVKSSNQNVSGLTTVTWSSATVNTDEMWSSGGSITAKTAGIYAWSAYLRVTGTAGSLFYVNGPGSYRMAQVLSGDMRITISGLWVAAANDVAQIDCEPTGGSGQVVDGTTTPAFFVATWLGQVS